MAQYVVIGASYFNDTSVGCGPFKSYAASLKVSEQLEHKGWNTEIIELCSVHDISFVSNDEGADE